MTRQSAVTLSVVYLLGTHVFAAEVGFVEDFSSGTAGFLGGSTITHVTSGGVGGAGDGYLQIANAITGNLGAYTQAAEFTGNLNLGGVTGFSFYLRDTGTDNNHEIHVGIGVPVSINDPGNFWQSVAGFVPPDGTWQQFSVDLSNPADWVQIIGSGSFTDAKAGSDRLLFRHDLPPFTQSPAAAAGEFGLDRLTVEPSDIPAVSTWGLFALALLVMTGGTLMMFRRRYTPAA